MNATNKSKKMHEQKNEKNWSSDNVGYKIKKFISYKKVIS